jgi:hypothetical protein
MRKNWRMNEMTYSLSAVYAPRTKNKENAEIKVNVSTQLKLYFVSILQLCK